MAKNRAKDVSLITFAEKFFKVQASGGTIEDVMNACEMENLGSARQKLNKLREQYRENGHGELPSLKHMGRSPNKGETVGQTAANRLAALFAGTATGETDDVESSSDDTVSATVGTESGLSAKIHSLVEQARDLTEVASKVETEMNQSV